MWNLALPTIGAAFKGGLGIAQTLMGAFKKVPQAEYKVSPYALNALATAKQLNNARMAGAVTAEQNIMGNNANTAASVGRNSTDASQSLAMLGALQGQTDSSLISLGQQEAANKMNTVNNLNYANATMTGEHDKLYQDAVRKENNAMQQKSALLQSGLTNISNSFKEGGDVNMLQQLLKANGANGNIAGILAALKQINPNPNS